MPLKTQHPKHQISLKIFQESKKWNLIKKKIKLKKKKKLTFDAYKISTTSCRYRGQLLQTESARFSNPCSTFAQENLWSGKNINMEFLSKLKNKQIKHDFSEPRSKQSSEKHLPNKIRASKATLHTPKLFYLSLIS